MIKNVDKILDEFFQSKDIKLEDLYIVIKTTNSNTSINALFYYINSIIDKYHGKGNLSRVIKAINMIEDIISVNTDVNRKLIKRRIKKLFEKNNRKIVESNENEIRDNNKLRKEIGKVDSKLNELDSVVKRKENDQYNFIKCIVEDTKNLNYLEQTLYQFPGYVNVIDKNGKSLFYNVIKRYIKLLEEDIDNKEDIHYYHSVINIMRNDNSLDLSSKDRAECLTMLYEAIDKVRRTDKDIDEKLRLLSNVTNTIIEDPDKINMDRLVTKYDIHIGFNNTLMDEVNLYKKSSIKSDAGVFDDYIITIDDDIVTEIDDGLSIKQLKNGNYLLGVHISDPLAYIPFTSGLVNEAVERASSIYLPKGDYLVNSENFYNKVITMFPENFSVYQVSLRENEEKFATTYLFEIEKDGNIVDQRYLKTIVKNNKKCSYKTVNSIIANGCGDKKLLETVNMLDELAYILEENEQSTEIYEDIKQKSFNASNTRVGRSRAGMIINKTMTLTGNMVANYFSDNNYPTLYRVHSINKDDIKMLEEEIEKLTNVYDKEKFNKLYQTLLGIYPKAKYDISGSHDGLGLEHYCHTTSPLRRAADLVVNHGLDLCYFKDPSDKEMYRLEEDVKKYKDIINCKNAEIELFLTEYSKQKCKRRHKKM